MREQEGLQSCGVVRRLDSGDLVQCTNPATHTVVTPYGTKKTTCADCAQQYVYAGFLVAPAESICSGCLRVKPGKNYELRCWCGGPAKRFNVDGFWLSLCDVHKPVAINVLWRRLWLRVVDRIKCFFVRPKQLSAVEVMKLTEMAREKALREHRR